MTYPLVLDPAAYGIPVTVTSRVLQFSTQTFYKWRKAPVSQRDWDDAHLIYAAATSTPMNLHSATDSSLMSCPRAGSPPESRASRLCSQERI